MNILEQKRKLLGHCYMGGGGSSSGGGGAGGDARAGMGFAGTGSGLSGSGAAAASRGEGGGQGGGGRDSAAQAREAAEAAAAEDANRQAIQAEADRAAREQAARDAAKAADARMAAEQATREQAEQASREQATREQAARDARDAQMAAEQASREQVAREQAASDARDAQEASERAAVTSPLAAMSSAGQMTPENADALANQETVRSYLAQVAKDKENALTKPGESYNVSDPNVGTNLTNAALAAVASGLNEQTIQLPGFGKSADPRDVTTLTSNIPIASFLGYTGADGDAGISYGEAKQLKDLGLGNLTGVNLNNMPGTGLSVMGGDGIPVGGLTYNDPGQTADSIVAATDAAEVAGKVFDAVKNFIPGYGMVTLAADLLSGKKTLGDLVVSIGVNKLAPMLGTTPAALTALANGNFADAITGQLMGYAVKDISKTYGIDPRLATIGLGELGVPRAVNQALSPANLNLGTTRAISGAIQSPINAAANYVGANIGSGTSTGNVTDMGDSLDSQIDRAISGGSSQGSTQGSTFTPSAPAPTPTAPATPATPSSPLSTLSIPAIGAAGASSGSDGGSSGASSSPGSSLKESWLGGTGTSAKGGKSVIDPLSATSPSISRSENMDDIQTAGDYIPKPDFYSYGDVPDISTNLQLKKGGSVPSPLVAANKAVRKASGGGIMATPLMAASGGDVPHKGSHYVQGAGGGQDDLIDARLADGEYVFDADIVAALGDGSNKEGAKKLDAMRRAIRKHKRSAPADKIPPKAKSPLAYMRG